MVLKDVENVDKQDDGATRRIFILLCLMQQPQQKAAYTRSATVFMDYLCTPFSSVRSNHLILGLYIDIA